MDTYPLIREKLSFNFGYSKEHRKNGDEWKVAGRQKSLTPIGSEAAGLKKGILNMVEVLTGYCRMRKHLHLIRKEATVKTAWQQMHLLYKT